MATTTNYAWETPDDTDLVKDGAAAIRTLGSSIDTTTKALNPSTTLGDMEYRSSTANTNTRLPIGTTGQILTVSNGVPTWSAPAAGGGLTLLSTTSLSGSGTVTVSSISQSYKNLYVYVKDFYATTDSVINLRMNGNTASRYNYTFDEGGTNYYSDSGYNSIRNVNIIDNGTHNYGDGAVSATATLVIYDYARTDSMKNFQWFGGGVWAPITNWTAWDGGGVFMAHQAITSISTYMASNFSAGTMYIYGEN